MKIEISRELFVCVVLYCCTVVTVLFPIAIRLRKEKRKLKREIEKASRYREASLLPRVLNNAGFADDHNLDLSWVVQLLLDVCCDSAGELACLMV